MKIDKKGSRHILKRLILCILVMSLVGGIFTACGKKETKKESLADKKKFIVGFDAEFPPYGYKDEMVSM